MKAITFCRVSLLAALLVLVGCGKEESPVSSPASGGEPGGGVVVSTAPLEQNFQSVEPAVKSSVDKAVALIKAGDYSGAMTHLKSVAQNVNLTPEQKQAVQDTINQVQTKLASALQGAADQAGKAAEDLQKALPK